MIQSKLISKYKNISHGFFNSLGGYSKGNYNTTISLPLSLLECDIDSDYCIL